MSTPLPAKERAQKALDQMAEFAKYTTALATGALVFSAELIKNDVSLTEHAKGFLVAGWITLTLSIVAGILSLARVPVMTAEDNQDMEDVYLVLPGRIHQLLFLGGAIFLGITLVLALLKK